jgi:hypothetical protein
MIKYERTITIMIKDVCESSRAAWDSRRGVLRCGFRLSEIHRESFSLDTILLVTGTVPYPAIAIVFSRILYQ